MTVINKLRYLSDGLAAGEDFEIEQTGSDDSGLESGRGEDTTTTECLHEGNVIGSDQSDFFHHL